jgi:hypothetical protein
VTADSDSFWANLHAQTLERDRLAALDAVTGVADAIVAYAALVEFGGFPPPDPEDLRVWADELRAAARLFGGAI